MSNTSLPQMAKPLRGIIPPMITPLAGRDSLDVAGLERLIEHILGGGVHGLFLLGTSGEAPSLSYRLRRELIERACRHVAGRAPILVGVTDTSFAETLHLSRFAAEAGAAALVVSAPYYFPPGQPELLEYLEHLVPELPLPLFLYNMPSHTKVMFEPETVRRAMEMPGIAGLKDSSCNMLYFHQLIGLAAARPDWSLLMGPEELLGEAVLLGAQGGVCGGANLCPRLYADLYEAAAKKDLPRVLALHAQVMRLASRIYRVGHHSSAIIKGIKCALGCLGVCGDFMAEPFHRFRAEEHRQIQQYLDELGITRAQPWPKA